EPADPGRRSGALAPGVEAPPDPPPGLDTATQRRGDAALAPPAPAPPRPHVPAPARAPLVLFDRVSKWYGPVIGVNQVTLELRPGITGLVGHNGSGKTTLLRLAAGHLRPDLGFVK